MPPGLRCSLPVVTASFPPTLLSAWPAFSVRATDETGKPVANAVIQQPLKISMMMVCPAQNGGGYLIKQAILTALQTAIQTHLLSGGSFTVITPAYTYTHCLLTSIRDITPVSDKQVQYVFQWDFVQPLITASGAQQVLGNLMNKFENGLPTPSNLTWNETAPTQVPASQSLAPGDSIL